MTFIFQDESTNVDRDVLINNKYSMAMGTAHQFLTVFLKKCGAKNEDIDYRPLFENLVQDLLTTVNTPEWPAAELLLSLLGRVLRDKFTNRSTEMPLRLSSLEYLGTVASRLRRDAVQGDPMRCSAKRCDTTPCDAMKTRSASHMDHTTHNTHVYSCASLLV